MLPLLQVSCRGVPAVCSDRSAAYWLDDLASCPSAASHNLLMDGTLATAPASESHIFQQSFQGGLNAAKPKQGWSSVVLPGNRWRCLLTFAHNCPLNCQIHFPSGFGFGLFMLDFAFWMFLHVKIPIRLHWPFGFRLDFYLFFSPFACCMSKYIDNLYFFV